MKALIAGGSGFIGSHLARHWVGEGHTVDLVDNFSRGARDADLQALLEEPSVRVLERDLLEPDSLSGEGRDYDVVVNLAAIVGVANVLGAPYRVLNDNTVLALNLLRFAAEQSRLSRFVFASTSEVYAGTLSAFGVEIPTPEATPLTVPELSDPRSSYMLSKVYGEALCHQAGLPFTIVRPHNFYGPRMGMSHVIPELLKRAHEASEGDELVVFSPEHRRTFCFIEDAVKMVSAAVEAPECAGETLNVGTQEPEVRIAALAEVVLEAVGKDLKLVGGPVHPGSPERRAPDMSKAARLVGRLPGTSLEEGVRRTYDWYRAHAFSGVS